MCFSAMFYIWILSLELLFLPREESRRPFSVLGKKYNCSVVALLLLSCFSPPPSDNNFKAQLLQDQAGLSLNLPSDNRETVEATLRTKSISTLSTGISQNVKPEWFGGGGEVLKSWQCWKSFTQKVGVSVPCQLFLHHSLITALDFQYLNFSTPIRLPTSVIFTFEMEFYLKIPNTSPSPRLNTKNLTNGLMDVGLIFVRWS